MFIKKWNTIFKCLLLGAILAAFTPGCSIQGYIAKKIAVSIGKKVYHGIKDQNEKQKEHKAREKTRKPVRDEEPE
jgi:hypothetical protein